MLRLVLFYVRARDEVRALPRNVRLKLGGPAPHRIQLDYGGRLAPLPDLDHRGVLARLPPMADVRGSYLPASSGWYPDPGVPFSYRLRLRLPAGQQGLVPGRLVQESKGESYRTEFEFSHPIEGIDLTSNNSLRRYRFLVDNSRHLSSWKKH